MTVTSDYFTKLVSEQRSVGLREEAAAYRLRPDDQRGSVLSPHRAESRRTTGRTDSVYQLRGAL